MVSVVLAMLRENEYHAIMLDELIEEKGLEVQSIQTNDPRDVHQYRYPRLQEKVLLVIDTDNHEVSLALRGANKVSYEIVQRVPKYLVAHPDTEKMPLYMKYEEQMEFFETRIEERKIRFEEKDVKSTLLKNLIRTPTAYRQLLTLKESLRPAEKISFEHLEDMFGEIDFYNLTQVMVDVIMGTYKRKTIKQLQYFTDYKEFSPRWLGDKLRETAVMLDYFYQLVNKGVLVSPKRLDDVRERMQVAGLKVPLELPSIREQYTYLEVVKEVPYKQVKKKIDTALRNEPITDEVSLYSLVTELRRGDDEDESKQ